MSDRKVFNVHGLYPSDYCFDWEAFEADPEHYAFTADDIAYFNAMELERFEMETPMTPYEKRAVRRWVLSGHSVMDAPPSKYPYIHSHYPPPCFLDVYRTDKELDAAMKGMTRKEKRAYLMEYVGFQDEPEEQRRQREENQRIHAQAPEKAKEKIRLLQRKLFYIWMFLSQEGLEEDAEEYVKDHMDEPIPFEDEW